MVLQHHLVFVCTFALDSEERVVKQNADISTRCKFLKYLFSQRTNKSTRTHFQFSFISHSIASHYMKSIIHHSSDVQQ